MKAETFGNGLPFVEFRLPDPIVTRRAAADPGGPVGAVMWSPVAATLLNVTQSNLGPSRRALAW
jgi:hypothetical protein